MLLFCLLDASFMHLLVIRVWIMAVISWQIRQLLAVAADRTFRIPVHPKTDMQSGPSPPLSSPTTQMPSNADSFPLFFFYLEKMISLFVLPKSTVTVKDGSCNWSFDRKLFCFSVSSPSLSMLSHWSRGPGLIKQVERVTFLTQAQSAKGCVANN